MTNGLFSNVSAVMMGIVAFIFMVLFFLTVFIILKVVNKVGKDNDKGEDS